MSPDTVVVLAKSPVAGSVKTRLSPTFSTREAAALASAAIRDTLDAVADATPRHTVIAWDGPPARWLPATATVIGQRGQGLDERLENVFADLLSADDDRPTLLVGMDTPQLTAADLDVGWDGADAVLGLCEDGGYWAIGFRRHHPGAILGVPMSTARTGADQLGRLHAMGLRVRLLPRMTDVDGPADARLVADLAPDSRFGRLHRRLVATPCDPTALFEAAMAGADVHARFGGAHAVCRLLEVSSWLAMSPADDLLVSRCEPPVLDIGCGPGRFVEALAAKGIAALGVDVSRDAVARTSGRGGCALARDVHDRLPGEGRWGTVVLADGNIGIGGDPLRLLLRCRELLGPGAVALVETSPNDVKGVEGARAMLTLHEAHGRSSHPVPWAVVGTTRLVELAHRAGFVAVEHWQADGRAFVALRPAG